MKTLVHNAIIVNEGRTFRGSIVIDNSVISEIAEDGRRPIGVFDSEIDAHGCYLLPGIIDDHVHFREPGLTRKADITSESAAAAAGGVTSYFDMPNTVPQTTSHEALEEKFRLAREKSVVNYSFFFGATNDNADMLDSIDYRRIPGVKLFMGSSTGNMLVDKSEKLEQFFRNVKKPLMVHCEDTSIINKNMAEAKARFGDDPSIGYHPQIRSAEACYESSSLAVRLAKKYGTRLHVAHVSTAQELSLFNAGDKMITAEAVVGHLLFCDDDYERLGAKIKVNPAIKSRDDRDALRKALVDGRISVVATDHAPHLPTEKQGGCCTAASGMPMIQFSLVSMLELSDMGVLPVERVVELMCHNPAELFCIRERGFIRKGYKADLVMLRRNNPWTVDSSMILSKCGWSPMEGRCFRWKVMMTICNGRPVYTDSDGVIARDAGEEIKFI